MIPLSQTAQMGGSDEPIYLRPQTSYIPTYREGQGLDTQLGVSTVVHGVTYSSVQAQHVDALTHHTRVVLYPHGQDIVLPLYRALGAALHIQYATAVKKSMCFAKAHSLLRCQR